MATSSKSVTMLRRRRCDIRISPLRVGATSTEKGQPWVWGICSSLLRKLPKRNRNPARRVRGSRTSMPRTAKRALKPHVERWLKELDDCFKTLTEWDSVMERAVQRKVLIHPAPVEHTRRLHQLVLADYSPLVSRAEAFRIEESGEKVPQQERNFRPTSTGASSKNGTAGVN